MLIIKVKQRTPRTVRCVKCRRKWNISIYTVFPESGYECLICKGLLNQSTEEQKMITEHGYALNAYL